MSSSSSRRKAKKKRRNTLDPSVNLSSFSKSKSPSPINKLKAKKRNSIVSKSKSPSGKRNSISLAKKKNKKKRSTSDAPTHAMAKSMALMPIQDLLEDATDDKKKPKKKKQNKQRSQTPATDYVGVMDSDDPFGVKKKKKTNKLSPVKVSLTSTAKGISFDTDDELNGQQVRSKSARFSSRTRKDKTNDNMMHDICSSQCIARASKSLRFVKQRLDDDIDENFATFHDALNAQKQKLFDDLASVYESKRNELSDIEKKLYQNAKTSKKSSTDHAFDGNMKLILDSEKIAKQIETFGYIQGVEPSGHSTSSSVIFNGSLAQLDEQSDDDEEGKAQQSDSVAAKQKIVLAQIQSKTMEKLDIVIKMEQHAHQKRLLAERLTREVDESLKYIDERTKIINAKIEDAKPELEKARIAANGVDPREINEIKSLKSPPIVIENVITATVMILGHKIKCWRDVQKVLSYRFKPELLNFDTYTLTKERRQKVYKKYAGKPDFNYDRVHEGSKACGNLVLWVLCQIHYSRILDVIIPLEKELKVLKRDTKKKQKMARTLTNIVGQLEANIELYTGQCNQMIDVIIKSTEHELNEFSRELQPLNDKFNSILNDPVFQK